MENLATACNKCNGRKSAAPLDKWGERPTEKPIKGKYGEPENWDGLSSVFVMLAEHDPAALTASEKDWLRALRSDPAGYNHRAPVRQSLMTDPMNSSEVIIKLGAKGGSVTLYGTRAERGWHFIREVDDCTPGLIDEERIKHQSAVADSWEAALGLLDKYPWYRLHPIVIHPDFRERILLAVQQRLQDNLENPSLELERWRDFCQ
jgi:hypothetical protein